MTSMCSGLKHDRGGGGGAMLVVDDGGSHSSRVFRQDFLVGFSFIKEEGSQGPNLCFLFRSCSRQLPPTKQSHDERACGMLHK